MKKILSNAAQRLQWWNSLEEHWQIILTEAINSPLKPSDKELKLLLKMTKN